MADREAAREDMSNDDESEEEGEVLDMEGQGLTSIQLPDNANPQTLILNNNDLTKLDGLEVYSGLSQLSAANNHIVRITGMHMLTSLTVLSLSNNRIAAIEELDSLNQLMWLDLSSNCIKVIENLPKGGKLHYLDLSDNDITHISDLSTLNNLKTLLLHKNKISSLKSVTSSLPQNLEVLSLADNSIRDLNEISYLSGLHALQQLSLADNPCVLWTSDSKGFDYRSFVWNWCPSVHILDALVITEKERLFGEWLYSQGKGRQFHPGEHAQLLEYLAAVCTLTSTDHHDPEGDTKLSHILNQQRRFQQQQQEQEQKQLEHFQTKGSLSSPQERNFHVVHHIDPNVPERNAATYYVEPSSEQSEARCVWANPSDVSVLTHTNRNPHAYDANDLTLQDLSYDCDARSSVSLLESESVYLPFDVPASPVALRRPFTAPETQSRFSSKSTLGDTVAASSSFHQPRPFSGPGDSTYSSLEQRPICPLNQHIGKSIHRAGLYVTRPVTSNAEPRISTHKDNILLTARSQDYESGGEQTNESESAPSELLKFQTAQPSVNSSMNSNMKSAPQDKLSHIKNVAGNKKVASLSGNSVHEKTNNAAKFKEGGNIMKTVTPSETASNTTAIISSFTASALVQTRMFKDSAVSLESNTSKLYITETDSNNLFRDSTKLDRPDHVGDSKLVKGKLNQENKEHTRNVASDKINTAATKMQAFWRGYRTRQFSAQVVSVRKEIRARRAEDHILLLRQDLERNCKLYDEEKQLRILQMEAIRLLYKEVQELKSHNLVSSKDLSSIDEGNDTAHTAFGLSSKATVSPSTARDSELNRTQELERTCVSLQTQVSQLQEALQTMSSAVFKTNSFDRADFEISDHSDKILVTPISDRQFSNSNQADETNQWGCIPHSLSPYPSEEEDLYYLQVSARGAPTPPRNLQLRHVSHHSLLLSWKPSSCGQEWEEDGNKHIIGYRVYVNDQLKAFVCQKSSVLVEGLNPSTTYKFCVKALSGFGESFESNIIMAKLVKGQEMPKFLASCGTDSSQDSDRDDSIDNEKLRCKNRKMRKSPRSSEKLRGTKTSAHHRRHQEKVTKCGEETADIMNISNNCAVDNTAFAILTHPKLHTHRRHRSKDRSEESNYCPSETTSQESSPCAGTTVRVDGKKPEDTFTSLQTASASSPFSSRSSRGTNSRRFLEFSKTELRQEEDIDVNINKSTHKPANENLAIWKKESASRIKDSPPAGFRIQESPSRRTRKEDNSADKIQKVSPQISPASGTESESRQKASSRSGTEILPLKMSPPVEENGNQSSTFSETFTVDKAHSYLESVSAIAQSVLRDKSVGKHGSQDLKQTRNRDQQPQGNKASSFQDCLSIEEAARLGIGKQREKITSDGSNKDTYNGEIEGRERFDSAGKVKGHRRIRSKDNGLQIISSKRDDNGGEMEESRKDFVAENQFYRNNYDINKTADDSASKTVSEVKDSGITMSSQPVIDGRRRHSSGSRPSSPVVSVGSGERSRMTVAELMMEQKMRGSNMSTSLNYLSGRTDDGRSRPDNNRRSPSLESLPSSSQGDTSQYMNCDHEGDSTKKSSKRTLSSESSMNTLTETSKIFYSNESLAGSVQAETRKSPSNESLAEGRRDETEKNSANQSNTNRLDQSSLSQTEASGCKRSLSMGSVQDLKRKVNRDSISTRTNSLVSKLLLKLESITRNSSSAFKEKNEAFKLKKSESDEKDTDAGLSKPPSDDERKSGSRSRNLSDSDVEGRMSDQGSQLPPRVPGDNSSGSHSDDNRHSRTSHRRTPSDHRPAESSRPTHSPIIMEGGMMKKSSSSMRRNQSFHGLLPSKHQDTKTSPMSNEEVAVKNEDQAANLLPVDSPACPPSHMRSRTPSPSRGRKPVLSAAQLKNLTESGKSGLDFSAKS